MKKIINLLIVTLFIASNAIAQFKFLPDKESQSANGSMIRDWAITLGVSSFATTPYPVGLTDRTQVSEWDYMHANSSTWNNLYEFKSVRDIVRVRVNHDIADIVPAYNYKVEILVYKYSPGAMYPMPTGLPTPETKYLYLSFDPAAMEKYNDQSVLSFTGCFKFQVAISGVYEAIPTGGYATTSLAPADIAKNFFIESEIISQRYDKTPMYINPDCAASTDARFLNVSGFLSTTMGGGSPFAGSLNYKPAAYELEWTYIDDYQYDINTATKSFKYPSSSTLDYDFRKNSTRVQLDLPIYSIPLIYEHGAIVYRFRMIRPKFANYQQIEYGPWTLIDNGTLSLTSTVDPFSHYGYIIQNPHTDDSLNWQYTINFAEQGKFKHVINYFDGSLKDRQTQTKINSNADNVVVVDKVYDYEGRPSIVSLPTPVTQPNLYYRSDILINNTTTQPYKAEDFDGPGCTRPGEISALASTSVANMYYSPLNPDKSGMQQFVPDAEGYPMVQTVYSPDNTNKVQWQGGAGKEQQLSKGHGTQYEYVRARQPELDKYLGTEAGYDRYYPKQIVTDPNGQSSYSILNPQGKVVISALQGESPDDEATPIEKLSNFVAGAELCSDILKNEEQNKLKNGLEAFTTTYNDGSGKNTLYYKVTTYPYYTACTNQYLWTNGYYDIKVTDDCGTPYTALSTSGTVNPSVVTAYGATTGSGTGKTEAETSPILTDLAVPKGKVLIDKKITFSEYDINQQVRGFIKANEPVCYNDEHYFIRQAVENTEFPCKTEFDDPTDDDSPCDVLKQQMIDDLFPDAKYGKYEKTEDNRFKAEAANSIFSIIEKVNPAATGSLEGPTDQCAVTGCTSVTTCADGREGCGCTVKHNYPDRCCTQCLVSHCACIIFPAILTTTGSTPITVMAKCTGDLRGSRFYAWPGALTEFFDDIDHKPFSYTESSGKVIYCIWYAKIMTCSCSEIDTVWGWEGYDYAPHRSGSSIYTGIQIRSSSFAPFAFGEHNCPKTYSEPTFGYTIGVTASYRYQADCINYPTITYKGATYNSAAIKALDPQSFIKIFNRELAEALLPLHPEYCKLANCEAFSGTFEQKFEELETFQEAEAAGLFTLTDILAEDPFNTFLSTYGTFDAHTLEYFPYNKERFEGLTSAPPRPYGTWKIDKLALAKTYCGAGNDEEMRHCEATKYNSEINTPTYLNDDLKQQYFQTLQALYIGNRNMAKQYLLDYLNGVPGCSPCPEFRMTLIGDPLFKGFDTYTMRSDGITPEMISEEEGFSSFPEWKKELYRGKTTSTLPTEFYDEYNEDQLKLANAEVDAIGEALIGCGLSNSDTNILNPQLRSLILAGTKITPAILKDKLTTIVGPSVLNDLCHPFLVTYGLIPNKSTALDAKASISNFACGDATVYSGLEAFLDKSTTTYLIANAWDSYGPGPITSATVTLDPSNAFEAKIISLLSLTTPYSTTIESKIFKVDPTCITGTCNTYVQLTMPTGDYINILAKTPTASNDIYNFANSIASGSMLDFQNPKCINEDPEADNFGLITQKTASINAVCMSSPSTYCHSTPSVGYYVWSSFADLMTPAPAATTMANAITCVDVKKAMETFKSADKSTYNYSDKANHPHYEQTITNYLNFTFNKKYTFQQYRDLMDGCALSDQVTIGRETSNMRIEFSTDADANAFVTQINGLGLYQPNLFRYKTGSTPIILVDLSPINSQDVGPYMAYLNGTGGPIVPTIAGVITRDPHYTATDNLLFTSSSCGFSSAVLPSGSSYTATTGVSVWENGAYNSAYTLHTFAPASTATVKDKADFQAAVKAYLKDATPTTGSGDACKVSYAFYTEELLRNADYSNPLRTAYLSYIYGISPDAHGNVITNITPTVLPTASAMSSYASKTFSYDNPYCLGDRKHLYAYKPNPTATEAPGYDLVKNTIISTVNTATSNKPFPDADITYYATAAAPFREPLAVIRKANGSYWYRFFNNTDNKNYNIYITPPSKKLARAPKDYTFSSIQMGPHPNTFMITLSAAATSALPALTTTVIGYADFPLATTSLVASNLILDENPKGVSCFDTLDCESDLLATAILNGKAAYYQYFEQNVAAMSTDYMNHLINTTEEELTYCSRQQQYQQTLYYYDRVGNLTRTVPPMGVETVPDAGYVPFSGPRVYGLDDVDKYRDDPEQYYLDYPSSYGPENLTKHRKISEYRYNSLNQLIYQKTPDGGITYFFYDAAGRQIFSQNSKQRKDGLYTYSIYDAQGRPEESGQIDIGCHYSSDVDFDLNPCTIYFTRYSGGASIGISGSHPDYVQNAFDENSYPYEVLKYIIRNKKRSEVVYTTYDNETQNIGAIASEMLSAQENLRSRVAAIKYYRQLPPIWAYTPITIPDGTFSTYYSYDLSGNVQTITYDYPQLGSSYDQRYKRVDYDYDLVSGKVNMVSYNRGHPDQFYQQYDYDADNRITQVNTSNDGLIWNKDAQYEYYKHGPLARLQVGNQKIQSLEYAYTIQGWLKAINGDVLNPDHEMGKNGLSGDYTYPRDVIAHTLRYFKDDYKPIGTTDVVNIADLSTDLDLFNGNISKQTTGIAGLGTMQRIYQYDQLQRLKLATNTMVDDEALTLATTPLQLFQSSYSYDKDGNISTLERWDGNASSPVQIDNFTYSYEDPLIGGAHNNNKLLQVNDLAGATTPSSPSLGGDDLQPGQLAENYSYDKIGNLIRDKQGAEHILWDRFGKITSIRDTASHRYIYFGYDGKGNRIWKEVVQPLISGGTDDRQGEYYVRDAGGNILSVYRTRSKYNRATTISTLLATPSVVGTTLLGTLGTLTDRSYPTALMALMHSTHTGFVSTYTDKPISYYLAADNTLKSNLLFSGEAWIDALRVADPTSTTDAFLRAGIEVQPLFFSALDLPAEGPKLLEHFSTEMPEPDCQSIWATMQTPFVPAAHAANGLNLYNAIVANPQLKPALIDQLVNTININHADTLPHATNYYNAVIADNSLWQSVPLRSQNGPWTVGIRTIINNNAEDTAIASFFDTWSGAAAALTACTSPEYKLTAVYQQAPSTALHDMSAEASTAEIVDILSIMEDLTTAEFGAKLIGSGAVEMEVQNALAMGTSGDTVSLAEHHIYGSSRLGVQRYDSTSIANIIRIPTLADERRTLRNRVPWYSYPFTDIIDSAERSPYQATLTGYAYLGNLETSRTLGRRYYEMTDHLGNVLATVLDRKTGALPLSGGAGGGLYDHWLADIASSADYYPGGMMMPGRNTEHDWSRMGYNGKQKDDEFYGKGNWVDYGERGLDTRLNIWRTPDQLFAKYPSISPYAAVGNNPIVNREIDGRDYAMYVNHDTKTIVIKATFYTAKGDVSSAASAKTETQFWNNASGKYQYNVYNGNEKIAYDVVFELNTLDVDNPGNQVMVDRFVPEEVALFNKTPLITDKSSNAYFVKPDGDAVFNRNGDGENVNGVTFDGNNVNVKSSQVGNETGSHEIGHALGMRHREDGLMTESSTDAKRTKEISPLDIQLIIKNAIKKDPESGGKGKIYETGKPPASKAGFKRGEVKEKKK